MRASKIQEIDYANATLVMENQDTCIMSRKGKKVLKEYFETLGEVYHGV